AYSFKTLGLPDHGHFDDAHELAAGGTAARRQRPDVGHRRGDRAAPGIESDRGDGNAGDVGQGNTDALARVYVADDDVRVVFERRRHAAVRVLPDEPAVAPRAI